MLTHTLMEIEIAIADFFGYRQNVIIPNVSWGMGLSYEADMIIISASRFCTEIELKVSKSDLKADAKKWKWKLHNTGKGIIRRRFFGIPRTLLDAVEFIPIECGVISFTEAGSVFTVRAASLRPARPLTEKEYLHALHLASMRTWTLKKHLLNQRQSPTSQRESEG